MDANTIVNGAYHSAVLGVLMITNSMAAQKLLKVKPADLSQFSIKDTGMLIGNIYIAMMTKQALIKQGILPANIKLPPA